MTFLEFLNEQKPDNMTVEQATRYYIAEKNDLPPAKMKQAIAAPAASVDAVQRQFEQDPVLLQNACLAVLSAGWDEDESLIRDAFAEAKAKLPVIEVGILAIVAMYGMYLKVTGGVKKRVVERKPDGTYKETVEFATPEGPIGLIVKLIKAAGGGE